MKEIRSVDIPDFFHKFTKIKYLRSLLRYFSYSPSTQLWVDENRDVYVQSNKGLVFINATPDYEHMDELMDLLPDQCYIVVPQDKYNDDWKPIFAQKWDKVVTYDRYSFSSTNLEIEVLQEKQKEVPEGFELREMTDDDVHYLEGDMGKSIRKIWGSMYRIFKQNTGFGIFDTQGDKLISLCMGSPWLEGKEEIDIRTRNDDKYRRKGLATIAARAYIIDALERGVKPEWDAATEISKKMALKLGFTDPTQYTVYGVAMSDESDEN